MNLVLKHTLIFVGYFFAQVFVFNHFSLFDIATAHVFIVALLVIPIHTPFSLLIIIAFFGGLLVDVFSSGVFVGIHAFSAVFVMALRNFWVFTFTNRVTFKGNESHLIQTQPFVWQAQYILPLVLIYEIIYQMLEVFTFDQFPTTLLRIGGSTIFTGSLSLLFLFVFHRNTRR